MSLVDPTQALLEAAMRGAWQRQTALTNNLANADTPGYRREEVNFESTLRSAMSEGVSPASVEFQTEAEPLQTGPNGSSVSVDEESAKLAENSLDYEALTDVLNTRNAVLKTAMGMS